MILGILNYRMYCILQRLKISATKNTFFNSVDTGNIVLTNIQHSMIIHNWIHFLKVSRMQTNALLLYSNTLFNSNYFIEGLSIAEYYIKWVYLKLMTV